MSFGLALRIVAAALVLVTTSGAVTLGRACCLFVENDVVTCCEQRGEVCSRVEEPPCCDDSDAVSANADRAERHAVDAAQLVAAVIALPRVVEAVPETTFGSPGRELPDDTPRFQATSRLLL